MIVLIVMVSIFYSKSGTFGEELTKCKGKCVKSASECKPGEVALIKTSCNYDNQVEDICCQPTGIEVG
ncbi:hypothetical protein D6764_05825 [Candidatus Woesearchaeota archaeon]|nr:MAG: hypothetical protein D6764_05825 [Candidatus Woesearchaeota archaeon]